MRDRFFVDDGADLRRLCRSLLLNTISSRLFSNTYFLRSVSGSASELMLVDCRFSVATDDTSLSCSFIMSDLCFTQGGHLWFLVGSLATACAVRAGSTCTASDDHLKWLPSQKSLRRGAVGTYSSSFTMIESAHGLKRCRQNS